MTQKEIVFEYLKRNKTITSKECMDKLDICDLQKAIQLLRDDNIKISDEWIKKTNKRGRKIKFKKYKLED